MKTLVNLSAGEHVCIVRFYCIGQFSGNHTVESIMCLNNNITCTVLGFTAIAFSDNNEHVQIVKLLM